MLWYNKTIMTAARPDYILLGLIIALVFIGTAILASVSAGLAINQTGSPTSYLFHQFLLGLFPGLIIGAVAFFISLDRIKKIAPFLLILNIILLAMVFLPVIGMSLGGAARWVKLGPLSFQPSEFLKLTFIIYLSAWLASKFQGRRTEAKDIFKEGLIAFLVVLGIAAGFLILQPDISTLGIIAVSALSLYFIAKTPIWHTALIIILGLVSLGALVKFSPYRMERFMVFLNPSLDPMGIGYHIKQALIMVGSGRLNGMGLGYGQQIKFLPAAISDAIFAPFAQQTGFLGAFLLVALFCLFAWKGFKIAKEAQDEFSRLLAIGITFWITFQAFINISAIIGMVPLAGIPLPFVSYGGSHLISELAGIGLLLNISKSNNL